MSNLTKYDIALIGLKLLAIYMAIHVISIVSNWLMILPNLFSQNTTGTIHAFAFWFFSLSLPVLMSAPILLWIFSDKIAAFATQSAPDMIATINDDSSNLQETLICVVGIIIFVLTIPGFLMSVVTIFRAYHQTAFNYHSLWQPLSSSAVLFIKLFLSLVLIFNARNLSHWLKQLRYAGVK